MIHWKQILLGKWNWKRPFMSIFSIYLILSVISCTFSDKLIHRPPRAGYTAELPGISVIESQDGTKIAISHLHAKPGMPTLLWSHGNAEDIGYLRRLHETMNAAGYGILSYDYPGYGISGGSPSEQGCYNAAMAAWKHLTETLNVSPQSTIIYGQSVGSGSSVWLATQVDASGLVLVAPFVSAFRTVTKIPIFPGDKFKNLSRIDQVNMPLLVIHGDQDKVIPQWHGKKLHNHHHGPKMWLGLKNVGHNDIYLRAEDQVIKSLADFRETYLKDAHQKNPATLHDTPDA